MKKYAAFLRGIMPSNPNMRNEKLRGVFESVGLSNVESIISSGNIIFESSTKNETKLEITLEDELEKKLGIKSPVFIRSLDQLKAILAKNPFKGKTHSRESYLIVTFIKEKPGELFNELDVTKTSTPDVMKNFDKRYGKENTTRTWKTLEKVVAKLDASKTK